MRKEIYFMPLGGGQSVGASSYFLRLNNKNILLDAGIGTMGKRVYEPNYFSLMTSPFIESINQLDHIYISHAHLDHIGCLPEILENSRQSNVYMTEMTYLLSVHQLYDKNYMMHQEQAESLRLAMLSLMDRISKVNFLQTINFEDYNVTFFPAGHIPGAMMMLFETGKRKILYTGDYSMTQTFLTDGCLFPKNYDIDTVIMCGLHAKHPNYRKKENQLEKTIQWVLNKFQHSSQSIRCYVPQLTKGIEFIKAINNFADTIPIYIDSSLLNIIQKIEKSGIPILAANNKIADKCAIPEQHIYITASYPNQNSHENYKDITINFSLHDDFEDMKNFIKTINPKKVIIVHSDVPLHPSDATIEQEIMRDTDCQTQFVFAEDNSIYKL